MATSFSTFLSDYPSHHLEFQGWTNDEVLRALIILHPAVEDAHHNRLILWSEFLHIAHDYYGLRDSTSMRLFNSVFLEFLNIILNGGYDVDQADLKQMFISASKGVIKNKATKLEKQRRNRRKKK